MTLTMTSVAARTTSSHRAEAMPASSTTSTTSDSPRRRSRLDRCQFLVAAVLNYFHLAPVRSLPRTCTVAFIGSGRVLPLLPSSSIRPPRPPRQSQSIISPTTSTSLYIFFDKFIHPYGVNNDQLLNKNDEDDAGMVELIDALLPRLRTKEDKSRILEGFQRARLDEQLRLSKLSRRGARKDHDVDVGRDPVEHHEEVARMADLFQQARLAEQLRLSMNRRRSSDGGNHDGTGGNFFDKDEAIHRALLEERLRIRRLQQRQIACSSDSIEKAREEYEIESEKEWKTLQLTMVQENESDLNESGDSDSGESDLDQQRVDSSASFIAGATSAINDGGQNKHIISSNLSVNQTEDASFEQQLHDKLDHLHNMVVIATSSSPSSSNVNWKNASSTVQNLVLSTYLPLPPREDASFISLIVAPMAHLLSAMFLMGSAVFYAVIAVLDVLYNDDKDDCSTRACLGTTSHVLRSCWDYMFLDEASTAPKWRATAKRTIRAVQTSLLASFYAAQCTLMRAITHSKYATACMDAGTGSLRYLVYVIRSVHVLWLRIVNAIQKLYSSQSRVEPNQRQSPLRILSNIRLSILRSSRNQRSLKDEQQRLRSNEMYNNKLRLLNLDRVNLERERHQLQEAQRQLEYEKRKLLAEGVNVLSWYLAARNAEAAASISGEKETMENRRVRKRHWNIWRRNNIN